MDVSDAAATGQAVSRDNSAVYDGDVVEILFNNALDGTYWLLTVNPAGSRRDSRLSGGQEDLGADRP